MLQSLGGATNTLLVLQPNLRSEADLLPVCGFSYGIRLKCATLVASSGASGRNVLPEIKRISWWWKWW